MKRWLPLILIATLMAIAYASGFADAISFENLRIHRAEIVSFVAERPYQAPLVYIGVYIVTVALSLPGGAMLSIIGGFLFPQPWATLFVLVGATTGAVCIFLAAQTALGDFMRKRAGGILKKMEKGLHENMVSYLLFIRMVPAFPFFLVNLAPALFGVPLRTYIWTTFIGIIPGAFVFTQAGTGIGSILDDGKELSMSTIFTTDVKIALCALALFSLLPVVVKKFRKS